MGYLNKLFSGNFLEYASYVIKDRAIPDIEDGMKPVQRRILHTLFESDDGKFHKVANVVGSAMKFHPHGDQSIYAALVNLANKELFIDRQGNFGNLYTGDEASAARYIECRLTQMARETLFFPEITEYVPSYDGRNSEPVRLPAKLPVLLAMGAEGIAVGMATKILPHNLVEVLKAEIAVLKDEPFQLFPDFITGGDMDVSEYEDGNGRVLLRAAIDTKDPKKVVIRELPYGQTTDSLIATIENAARKNKFKIASINDYTTENVEIEIALPRGVHSDDILDPLFAFTDCETSISVNLLAIVENRPRIMTVTEVVEYNARRLTEILKLELEFEMGELEQKLHIKTLEQIFIEKRIYKNIEEQKTRTGVLDSVMEGFIPYLDTIKREISQDDIEHLLKIPIRRISLYDINKAKKDMEEIRKRLKEIRHHLRYLIEYTIDYINALIQKYGHLYPRRTRIADFNKVDVREAAIRDLKLRYDSNEGYLGTDVKTGDPVLEVSPYDRILIMRKDGSYFVTDVPEKLFVDKGMAFCGFIEKQRIYTMIYRQKDSAYPYIKRFHIDKFILNKEYKPLAEGDTLLRLLTEPEQAFMLRYKPKPRMKQLEEEFSIQDFAVRGAGAGGIRLSKKEIRSLRMV